MTKVWHRKTPTFSETGALEAWKAGGYEMVAEVGAPSSDYTGYTEEDWAFFRTNTIDSVWTHNPGVKAVRQGLRSTSVGDIVERSDGKLLVCAFCGWQDLLPAAKAA